MSEWYDNQKKPSSDWRKKLAERMAARKQRKLTAKEKKRLEKLEGMLSCSLSVEKTCKIVSSNNG